MKSIILFLFFDILQRNNILSYNNKEVIHRYGDVMISVLASTWVYRGIDPRSGQTKD